MKKKLFHGLMVSLFVFTLFISVSNAEITSGKTYTVKATTVYSTQNKTVSTEFPEHTEESFISLLENYRDNPSESTFGVIYDLFKNKGSGYGYVYGSVHNTDYEVTIYAYSDSLYDFGIGLNADSEVSYLICNSNGGNYVRYKVQLTSDNNLTFQTQVTNSSDCCYHNLQSAYVTSHYRLDDSVKQLAYVSSTSWKWDGTSYYTPSTPEPEVPSGPEFSTELTDDEIADVVKNFSNSTYWKNRNSNYTGFFIQRNELNGNYAVMVVPDHLIRNKFVEGIYIPANASSSNYSVLDYDTYSIGHIKTGVPQLPWNQWIESFKLYGSSDGINFEYAGEMLASDYMKYRIPMTTPVIYSNFTIPFKTLIGDTTNSFDEIIDSFTEETDYNFSNLVNSETGESYEFDDVPVEDNPIIRALREFFTDLTGYLSSAFEFVINKIFNFSEYLLNEFGENVFTLLFAIVIEAFSALVAGISLLVRFAGFLLTLVAIPADSSLFNVLVDGNAWGTHFIEGLNFLKGLSWNNLNLWTFFECFVAALEVIWTVKIVRRHYSQVV